jgi:hypothetical protein
MPLVTAFNLRREDRLSELERALRAALVSLPELKIAEHEVDLVPVLAPDGFHATVARINVDLWERPERTKDALQALATSRARAGCRRETRRGRGLRREAWPPAP